MDHDQYENIKDRLTRIGVTVNNAEISRSEDVPAHTLFNSMNNPNKPHIMFGKTYSISSIRCSCDYDSDVHNYLLRTQVDKSFPIMINEFYSYASTELMSNDTRATDSVNDIDIDNSNFIVYFSIEFRHEHYDSVIELLDTVEYKLYSEQFDNSVAEELSNA